MKKLLLTLSLLFAGSAVAVMAQNTSPFHPIVENGVFYLYHGAGPDVSKVEIFNDNGDLVKEANLESNKEKTIRCEELVSGTYHVVIYVNDQEYYSALEVKNSIQTASSQDPK